MMLPAQYAWLVKEPGPKALLAAIPLVGTIEGPGTHDNPTIIAWADEIALLFPGGYDDWAANFYSGDAIPWCGLFHALIQARAGRAPVNQYLSALAWKNFGHSVTRPMLGDTMVKSRAGGGHVTMYVAEDDTHYHVLGGNQSDAVTIARYPKSIAWTFRRPNYNSQPGNVRVVKVAPGGAPVGGSEA